MSGPVFGRRTRPQKARAFARDLAVAAPPVAVATLGALGLGGPWVAILVATGIAAGLAAAFRQGPPLVRDSAILPLAVGAAAAALLLPASTFAEVLAGLLGLAVLLSLAVWTADSGSRRRSTATALTLPGLGVGVALASAMFLPSVGGQVGIAALLVVVALAALAVLFEPESGSATVKSAT